jgi:hypothetical protein
MCHETAAIIPRTAAQFGLAGKVVTGPANRHVPPNGYFDCKIGMRSADRRRRKGKIAGRHRKKLDPPQRDTIDI